MGFYDLAKAALGVVLALAAASCSRDEITLLAGTYTGSGSEGIYAYRFNQSSGTFVSHEAVGFAEIENPSFLTISGSDIVYAVTEKGGSEASLTSFRFNPDNYSFSKLATVPTVGQDPCYVSTNGDIVAVGNYTIGTMDIFRIGDDGAAIDGKAVVMGESSGANKRQCIPHIHCAVFSPDGKYLMASDFSYDRLVSYEIATGATEYFAVDSVTGPRHIAFSPDGRRMYALGELSGDVTVFDYHNGSLAKRQVINADKVDARGAADIHVSPDGRFLYASLRLQNDGIAIFSVADDGSLTEAGYANTGKHPRNFTISPNGRFLLCACRDDNKVEVYAIDSATGLLTKTEESIRLSKPVCLVWREN